MAQKKEEVEKSFLRDLGKSVKAELKPDFDQINLRFDSVDHRLSNLESSSNDIKGKLDKINNKLR